MIECLPKVAASPICYNLNMINDDEEVTLATMTVAEFDERIHAANERLAAEAEAMREQNKILHGLVAQYRDYLARLEITLGELQAERERMDAEVRRLLSPEEQATLRLTAAL